MSDSSKKLPGTFKAFSSRFPELASAHQTVNEIAEAQGPLDPKTCSLIKIALALGAGLESAVRSHVRRATERGATHEEIEQAIVLGMNTCGFPRTVAAWSWAQEQFRRDEAEKTG